LIDENFFSMYYISVFIIIALVNFYFFGMQRAAMIISRNASGDSRFVTVLLPDKFFLVRLITLAKYIILILMLLFYSWQTGLLCFGADCLAFILIPIPYRLLYSRVFTARVIRIFKSSSMVPYALIDSISRL